jgi:hypothetical protein
VNLDQRVTLLAQAVGTDVKTLRTSIGVLANLTSTSKSDIVSALNETLGKVATQSSAIGTLSSLATSAKSNLVAALNEVHASIAAIDSTGLLDDLADSTVTNKTFSAQKILSLIASTVSGLVDSAPATLNTLNELAAALGNDANFATSVAAAIGNRVRVDAAQSFTAGQQTQGRENIGAASTIAVSAAQSTANLAAADLATLTTAIGDTDHDYLVDYTAAKA